MSLPLLQPPRALALLALLLAWCTLVLGQGLLSPPPLGPVAHHAVLANARQEARLPPHLLNPFYRDPRIRAALAQHSWFGPGERPVYDRVAEQIPRREIYTVLNHAGLVDSTRNAA